MEASKFEVFNLQTIFYTIVIVDFANKRFTEYCVLLPVLLLYKVEILSSNQ